jgi:cellulose binding protein with CBM2 domain
MNGTETRPPSRRSPVVVVLDGVLRLFAAVQAGPTPQPKVREPGVRRGPGRYLVLAGVVVVLAATALLVAVLLRASGDPAPPPGPAAALPGLRSEPAAPSANGPAPHGTAAARTTSPTPTTQAIGPAVTATASSATASATTPLSPGAPVESATRPAELSATYTTSSATAGLLGYEMTVTVTNPGDAPRDGWTLTVTLPRPTLTVGQVSGATASQDGSTWTFTPSPDTARIAGGASVRVAFTVHGATLIAAAPQQCRIDGRPCG